MPEETSGASSSESSVDEKPCSSSAATTGSSVDVMEEAKKLIGTGNRHLVMGDVVSAVGVFQDACSMLAARYGDTAEECGEAFFLCGKSLLELARMENAVLGNALEGVPEESEDEEQPCNSNIESANNLDENTRDELRKQVYDAMAEKPEPVVTKAQSEDGQSSIEVKQENGLAESPTKQAGGDFGKHSASQLNGAEKSLVEEAQLNGVVNGAGESLKDGMAKTEEPNGEKTEADEENGDSKPEEEAEDDDDDDEDKEGDKEDDEVGNLQLAWEMLEVAKVIYKRKEGKEDQLMAAQAFLKLGEVGAETGNYPQALDDFQECLTLQLKHLPPHSRLLAETHYHVATMLCYMDHYSQAIQHYNSSIKVIESRLAMLQDLIDAAEGTEGLTEAKTELEELKQLLPDIREKIEDAEETQKTASAASQAIQQTLGGASTSSASLSENGCPSSGFAAPTQVPVKSAEGAMSSKVASDISHLVRKKRKPEESSPVKDTDAKQAKQEATFNGSGNSSANNGVEKQTSQEPAVQSASVQSSA
ncbi:histone-binding protein N1/N2-like isoform X2 [Phycodurus eques]|uniref:histone-binding protein N1/N2-like isoform X2 n=1 Tax=Phycodurus eques TaxID=693459 RepID=UPI002ACDD9B9|nr:histone-binding protein N1/N2-like isoform X2 [Phycodurus eques]